MKTRKCGKRQKGQMWGWVVLKVVAFAPGELALEKDGFLGERDRNGMTWKFKWVEMGSG